jgi:lysozyme family protein
MSIFEKCWPVIKQHEGTRFTNYAWDPGAATKFGITLRTARAYLGILDFDVDVNGVVDEDDIRLMDEPRAKRFYNHWWNKFGYSKIVDQQVACKCMDMSINMGPRGVARNGRIYGAHVMIQKGVNNCGYALILDGKLGPVTFAAINDCDSRELLLELCHLQSDHYRNWCDGFTKIPGDREVARLGLMKRAAWPFVKDGYLS